MACGLTPYNKVMKPRFSLALFGFIAVWMAVGPLAMADSSIISLDDSPPSSSAMMMQAMMQQGSGTGWQPADNPMLMQMGRLGNATTMLHGSVFADYDYQGGHRGGHKTVSENWLMGSVMAPVTDHGTLQLRAMMSAEPFSVGKDGYPELLQTGEALNGKPLIDRQHPHDLFMELSTQYTQCVSAQTCVNLYLAPVGEPALGPTAFPHRYSDWLIPEAPLSHHILDSTHVSFGVATVGVSHGKWLLEGSVFNGREPDENRYDFDYNPWHTSASGRLSYAPNPHWALQVSSGYLDRPEALESTNIERTTASASYDRTFKAGWWATTLAAGHNFESGPDDNGVLLESTLNFRNKNYVFGRIENIQRHGLIEDSPGRGFNVTTFGFGVARDLASVYGWPIILGAMITLYAMPSDLAMHYGRSPLSFHVFLHTNTPAMGNTMQMNQK